jgi:hypothetical protein
VRDSTNTKFSQRRFRWLLRLPILVVLAGSVAVALAVASVSATAAQTSRSQRLCSSVVSLGAIRNASGLAGMTRLGKAKRWTTSHDHFWPVGRKGRGNLPGSECVFGDLTPGTSYTQQAFGTPDVDDAYVTVGYGESPANWRALSKLLAAHGGREPDSNYIPSSFIQGHAPETRLKLGYGSKSFLNTGNLVAAKDADPIDDPQFPSSFYIVTVLSRSHNVLQIAMYGATLAATEVVVKQALKSNAL